MDDEQQEQEADPGLREAVEAVAAYPGRGATFEEALDDAWRRVPGEKKGGGVVVSQIRVGGNNPINWYGVILKG